MARMLYCRCLVWFFVMPPKKVSPIKKLALIALPLIALQIGFILFMGKGKAPRPLKEKLATEIEQNNAIPRERKAQAKIQIALSDFNAKKGKFPANLNLLVPDYFDSVPLDPSTGASFKYTLTDGGYQLGNPETQVAAAKSPNGTPVAPDKVGTPTQIAEDEAALMAVLDQKNLGEDYIYDPKNKRDPFRSYDFSPRTVIASGPTSLEQYGYDELKLAVVLEGFDSAKAVIEEPSGKGHTVQVGTKVGNLGGTVMKIESNKVIILEESVDFTGEKKTRTIEMLIR